MRAALHQNKVEAANNVITQSLHIRAHSLPAAVDCGHCWHCLGDARDVTACQEPVICLPLRPEAPGPRPAPDEWMRCETTVDERRRHVTSHVTQVPPFTGGPTESGPCWARRSDQLTDRAVVCRDDVDAVWTSSGSVSAEKSETTLTLHLFWSKVPRDWPTSPSAARVELIVDESFCSHTEPLKLKTDTEAGLAHGSQQQTHWGLQSSSSPLLVCRGWTISLQDRVRGLKPSRESERLRANKHILTRCVFRGITAEAISGTECYFSISSLIYTKLLFQNPNHRD